jgi:hypothetical protein
MGEPWLRGPRGQSTGLQNHVRRGRLHPSRWRPIPIPCRTYWDFSITLSAAKTLALGCASQGFPPFQEYKRVWVSGNGGHTWRQFADLPMHGYLGQVSITPDGTVVVSGGHSDAYISWDGGKSWHTSPSLNGADLGDGLSATMFTDTRGIVLQLSYYFPQIWLTQNRGHTWVPVTIH